MDDTWTNAETTIMIAGDLSEVREDRHRYLMKSHQPGQGQFAELPHPDPCSMKTYDNHRQGVEVGNLDP